MKLFICWILGSSYLPSYLCPKLAELLGKSQHLVLFTVKYEIATFKVLTMRYHNNMLCYCFTILRFMNDFQAIFSRKADVLYTIDVTYSHIFMNLVTNMR